MDEFQIRGRGRGNGERRGTHKNKHWVAGHENGVHSADNEKWERGGYRGGRGRGVRGRGGGSGRSTPFLAAAGPLYDDATSGAEDEAQDGMDATDTEIEVEGTEVDDPEERERYWKELVKARELEKKRMIAEKKWADPDAPMRLEDAITPVGTCTDMCPKFERYRREREHNLDKWEVIPGTKRVDHARAVKMYERASGSKSLPSDLRTPDACRRTLDYLFHDLLPRGGFTETHSFIRDRSRAVRNDFTPQLITGPIAIECHDRCARFHIVAMHVQRDVTGFDLRLEEQQLSHSLLSLQQFYEDQRGQYTSPTELEMRVYQRLISVRNLKERHEDVPVQITSHPVFQLTTRFLHHVQKESAPISRSSALRVGQEGMQIFGELAAVLREQHNTVMIYLTACILERLFGKDTIEDMESVRGSLTISDIIDGSQSTQAFTSSPDTITEVFDDPGMTSQGPAPMARSATEWLASNFGSQPAVPVSATTPSVPPATQGINGGSIPQPPRSAFANIKSVPNAFGGATFGSTASAFGGSTTPTSVFGGPRSAFPSAATTPSNVPSTFSAAPPPVPGSLFSADVKDKPFGSVPATAFSTPPSLTSTLQPPSSIAPTLQYAQPVVVTPVVLPQPSSLDPHAPSFQPFSKSFASSSSSTPPSSSVTPHPQIPITPHPQTIISHIAYTPPSTTLSFTTPTPAETDSKPATPQPKIIEKQQTLWEFPSAASPQKQHAQKPPAVEIPSSSSRQTTAPSTPIEPPKLGKAEPLPLPPTPTQRWFDPSSQQPPKPGSSSSLLRKQSLIGFPLQIPNSPTQAGMLSPLHIPTAGSLKWPVASGVPPSPTPAGTSSAQTPFPLTLPQGKGKAKEVEVDLDELAKVFKREHSPFVKCFRKWLKRTTDLALWEEACRRGEAYREKKEREKLSNSRRGALDKSSSKRRASSGTEPDSYAKKRARRRKSTDYKAAVTDEQLVQQLKENHEEHQRRWAHGSFLEAIRRRVEALSPDGDSPDAWRAWLSLNTDNDGTAIWLEHKFDMPQSGEWISDTVFSVPAVPKAQAGRMPLGSPGLVIFERTPLGDVEDAIERKYRVLDDCARLRDIVDGLSSDSQMRFLPSLLVINWQNAGEQDILRDFADMTESFVQAGHLKNVYTFAVSSTDKDLDKTFEQLVGGVDLEVEDRLVQTVSWQDLLEIFIDPFKSSASDWLHSCWIGEHFDWPRYNDVLSSIKEAQTQAVLGILAVLGKHAQVDIEIPVDMEAPAHLGMEYATGPFLNAFEKLTIAAAERLLGDKPQSSYTVLKERVSTASKTFQGTLESISSRLRESGVGILLQWSKRRADDDIDSPSTPKRLRPSISRETSDDTDNSVLEDSPPMGPPSTLATSTAGYSEPVEKPTVTAAMLRALARDILKSR